MTLVQNLPCGLGLKCLHRPLRATVTKINVDSYITHKSLHFAIFEKNFRLNLFLLPWGLSRYGIIPRGDSEKVDCIISRGVSFFKPKILITQ